MKVLVVEDNLLWSERLRRNLTSLGHDPTVITTIPHHLLEDWPEADVTIINLALRNLDLGAVVLACHGKGQRVIAHAGHKEKERIQQAMAHGCDQVATNGELFHQLDKVVARQ